tara:strand:+ start:5004 stop:5321 length:318 start_codon:yes stop_codon:yes gene_type:complete
MRSLRKEVEAAKIQALDHQYNTTRNDDMPFIREYVRRMSHDLAKHRHKKNSVKFALRGQRERYATLKKTIRRSIGQKQYLTPEAIVSLCDMVDEAWEAHEQTRPA